MNFTDLATTDGARLSEDGYLIATARCVRTGIQLYTGDEVGKPELKVVRVYRAPDQVFADASLQSFSHAPITDDHPKDPVNAGNWKDLAVGEVSTAAKKDGDWVMLPLIMKDAAAIKRIQQGKVQLSAGYQCELDWTPGVTADGQEYDAQQVGIKINHLALVDRARAGERARIGDGAYQWGISPVTQQKGVQDMDKLNMKTVTVDGVSYEVTDQGAQLIAKLQADNAKLVEDASKAEAKAATDLADANDKLAKADAEIATLKGQVLTGDALDQAVKARVDLVANAQKIGGGQLKLDGLSNADIKKAAVTARLGDAAVAGKPEAFFDHGFDLLLAQVPANQQTQVPGQVTDAQRLGGIVVDHTPSLNLGDARDKALEEANKRDREAWKRPA